MIIMRNILTLNLNKKNSLCNFKYCYFFGILQIAATGIRLRKNSLRKHDRVSFQQKQERKMLFFRLFFRGRCRRQRFFSFFLFGCKPNFCNNYIAGGKSLACHVCFLRFLASIRFRMAFARAARIIQPIVCDHILVFGSCNGLVVWELYVGSSCG